MTAPPATLEEAEAAMWAAQAVGGAAPGGVYLDALRRGLLGTLPVPCPVCGEACSTELADHDGVTIYYCEWCGSEWDSNREVLDCDGYVCGECDACLELAVGDDGYIPTAATEPATTAAPTGQLHTLYRFFDAAGALLYVGITKQPAARFKQHAHDKPWWGDVASSTMQHYPSREALREAEMVAIASEGPLHNIVGNRGRPRGGT